MKTTLTLVLILIVVSCKQAPKEETRMDPGQEVAVEAKSNDYPAELQKVFEAHGGLDVWRSKKVLSYEMPRQDFTETHTINLYSREDLIETAEYSMGFDGEQVWIHDEKGVYEGDPVFYHNLMFYFYAMPFVLADDGIQYGATEDLVYQSRHYPGIAISYGDDVGTSPEDEYFIHYDPETYQMAWLGYTVTYRTGEKSDNVKWIRYGEWTAVDGLLLPKSLTWHEYEGRTIKAASNTYVFDNVELSEEAKAADFFKMPEGAEVAPGRQGS